MPGNLAAASPTGVLPQTLSAAFTEARIFPMMAVPYHDSTVERSLITDGVNAARSLRTWRLGKNLTASAWVTLRTFFESKNGGLMPFYFYSPFEPASGQPVGSNYDATGISTQGRHTVIFRGDWAETVGMARIQGSLELQEIA